MSEKKSRRELVEELREIAGWTPPVCDLDKPHEVDVLGQKVTLYCKPFEQFQGLMREAAEAIEEYEPVRHGKWNDDGQCSECGAFDNKDPYGSKYCHNCGAKMDLEG